MEGIAVSLLFNLICLMLKILIAVVLLIGSDAFAQTPFWKSLGSASTTEPYISVYAGPSGDVYLGTQGPGVFRSSDQGATWDKDWEMPGWWAYAYEIYAPSADTVVVAAGQGFLRSIDSGKHWTTMNEGLTSAGLYDLAVSPKGDIYVLSIKGVISKTTDVGNTWIKIDSLPVKQANEIEVTSAGEILVGTYKAGLFTSSNEGANWEHKFDTSSVWKLKSRPDGTLFLSIDGRLYSTRDLGATLIDLDLTNPTDLELDSRGVLFASTYELPGIRFLDPEGKWQAYHSEGLSAIYDMSISSSDVMYAITFGYTAVRAGAATTSGVSRAQGNDRNAIKLIGSTLYCDEDMMLEIYDITGANRLSHRAIAGEPVDLGRQVLRPGVYLIRATQPSGAVGTQKILIH
jgi:hypothetical protein